jgi:ketosteroid isomerase-like protein
VTDTHPNVALVRSLFKGTGDEGASIAMDGYLEGGWDTLFADDVSYCGTSSHGNLQLALGKEAVFELSRDAAQLMVADEPGEELLDCVPFGDELVAVYARCHRKIKSTGESVSYEYVMVVRVERGRITRGVDVGEHKIDDIYRRARGLTTTPNVPATTGLSVLPRQQNGQFKETSE